MFRKFFVAMLLVAGGAVSAFAANVIAMDLNFYTKDGGTVKPVGELPAGVTMGRKIRFSNPKLKGFAYPVRIDFDKVKSIELKFVVSAGSGKLAPSLFGMVTDAEGKMTGKFVFRCTKLEFADEDSPRDLPMTIEKWINMFPPWGVPVTEGDIITVKATFESAE